MDRFIEIFQTVTQQHRPHLKSNMDRFIELVSQQINYKCPNLKSNMDRFIENIWYIKYIKQSKFKIQYG